MEALERRVALLKAKKPRCTSRRRHQAHLAGRFTLRTLIVQAWSQVPDAAAWEHVRLELEVNAIAASGATATQLAEGLAHAKIALDLLFAREERYTGFWCQTTDATVFSQTRRSREGAFGRSVHHWWHSEEVVRRPPCSSRAALWSHLDDPQELHGEAASAHAIEACAASLAAKLCVCCYRNEFANQEKIRFAGAVRYFKIPLGEATTAVDIWRQKSGRGRYTSTVCSPLQDWSQHLVGGLRLGLGRSRNRWRAPRCVIYIDMAGELMGADGPVMPNWGVCRQWRSSDRRRWWCVSRPTTSRGPTHFQQWPRPTCLRGIYGRRNCWVARRRRHPHMRRTQVTISRLRPLSHRPARTSTTNSPIAPSTQCSRTSSRWETWATHGDRSRLVSASTSSAEGGRKRVIRKAANTTATWARRAPRVIVFCRLRGWGSSFRNDWAPLGEVSANILSGKWIDKMWWFFDIYTNSQNPAYMKRKRVLRLMCNSPICGDDGNYIGVHSGSWLACAKFAASFRMVLRIRLYEWTLFLKALDLGQWNNERITWQSSSNFYLELPLLPQGGYGWGRWEFCGSTGDNLSDNPGDNVGVNVGDNFDPLFFGENHFWCGATTFLCQIWTTEKEPERTAETSIQLTGTPKLGDPYRNASLAHSQTSRCHQTITPPRLSLGQVAQVATTCTWLLSSKCVALQRRNVLVFCSTPCRVACSRKVHLTLALHRWLLCASSMRSSCLRLTTTRKATTLGTSSWNLSRTFGFGARIQSSLADEELGRVGLSCHYVMDCLCAELCALWGLLDHDWDCFGLLRRVQLQRERILFEEHVFGVAPTRCWFVVTSECTDCDFPWPMTQCDSSITTFNNYLAHRSFRNWKEMPSWRRSMNGQLKSRNSIMPENTRNLFHWPWGQGIQRNHQECLQEVGNTDGSRCALARQAKTVSMWRLWGNPIRSNQNLCVFWKQVNPQECIWKNLYQITKRTTLQEKETIRCSVTIWYTNLFLCLKPWKFQQQRQQRTRNGKHLRKFRRGT